MMKNSFNKRKSLKWKWSKIEIGVPIVNIILDYRGIELKTDQLLLYIFSDLSVLYLYSILSTELLVLSSYKVWCFINGVYILSNFHSRHIDSDKWWCLVTATTTTRHTSNLNIENNITIQILLEQRWSLAF